MSFDLLIDSYRILEKGFDHFEIDSNNFLRRRYIGLCVYMTYLNTIWVLNLIISSSPKRESKGGKNENRERQDE